MGWLYEARWIQKNASLRSRLVEKKKTASARTRPKSMYGLGTMGCKGIVAEFTAQRS
jgi:hypothetical protein